MTNNSRPDRIQSTKPSVPTQSLSPNIAFQGCFIYQLHFWINGFIFEHISLFEFQEEEKEKKKKEEKKITKEVENR